MLGRVLGAGCRGRAGATLTMQTMGSISLSLGTSIQVISMAPGSPGEHGVRRSSTMRLGLVREGPRTWRRGRKSWEGGTRRPPPTGSSPRPPAHLLEVHGRLHLAHGLHQGVPHDDADVGPRVALGLAGQLVNVGVRQRVRRVAQVQLEHLGARRLLGQRDVNALLEPERGTGGGSGGAHTAVRAGSPVGHSVVPRFGALRGNFMPLTSS